jgi:hypothetical protein
MGKAAAIRICLWNSLLLLYHIPASNDKIFAKSGGNASFAGMWQRKKAYSTLISGSSIPAGPS